MDTLLSAEQERKLGWAVWNDRCPIAMERLIRSQSGLVAAIAQRFANRGLGTTSLLTAGHTGLLDAVDHFNPGEGARFSTGASWWIKHAMRRALPLAALRSVSARDVPGRHQTSPDRGRDEAVRVRGRRIPPRL